MSPATARSCNLGTDLERTFADFPFDFRPYLRVLDESSDPAGHVLAAGLFGTLGYFEYLWEQRADELIALKREQIAQNRKNRTSTPSGA